MLIFVNIDFIIIKAINHYIQSKGKSQLTNTPALLCFDYNINVCIDKLEIIIISTLTLFPQICSMDLGIDLVPKSCN